MPATMPYSTDPEMDSKIADLHSSIIHEDMQEIISRPPAWLVRWGITVLLIVVASVILISYLIRYPEQLTIPLRLTSSAVPVAVSVRRPGRLAHLLVQNKQQVVQGQILGYLETIADPEQVRHLSAQLTVLRSHIENNHLAATNSVPATLAYDQLGELQSSFIAFKKAQAVYQTAYPLGFEKQQSKKNATQLAYLENYLQSVDMLRTEIAQWLQANAIVAQVAGTVHFASFLRPGQDVKSDQLMFYVVPKHEAADVYGEVTIAQEYMSKLTEGQEVTIQLSGYPASEFGLVKGRLTSLSDIPTADGTLFAQVILPEGLKTTHDKTIFYHPGMLATAQITIRNPRLLEKVFASASRRADR
jgi:multidrug resistance efflux pump